ncbi:pollen allergen Che a 1-like [Silene latifolia]|uniref:pollen allergen Che a 1-like n=1 Tax=Silene latifolia TaxID=37657 RepID=UPI003D78667F
MNTILTNYTRLMAKPQTIFVLAGAICVLSLATTASAVDNRFFVQGMVYCDTCRIQFITRVTHMLEGATVKLECRNITAGTVTFSKETMTDKLGLYSIPVDGDHEDDVCQINLVKSPNEDCSEIPTDIYSQQAAKVSLTNNNGEVTPVRNANALGFLNKVPLHECPEVLKELDIDPNGNMAQV